MTKSRLVRSTPFAFTLAANVSPSLPVSNKIRLPATSTSAEKPQSFFIAASVPKASYRIVILDSAAAAVSVTAVKTAALASTAKAIVCVVGKARLRHPVSATGRHGAGGRGLDPRAEVRRLPH